MNVALKKSGNSFVIPVPKAILELFGYQEGSKFEIHTENDQMVIRAKDTRSQKFEAVANKVLSENEDLFRSLAGK